MKTLLFLITINLSINLLYSQPTDTLYFNPSNQITTSQDYSYFRVITKTENNHYVIMDYFKNGNKKLECEYVPKGKFIPESTDFLSISSAEKKSKLKLNGIYKTFYSTGIRKSEQKFEKGKKIGWEKQFMENGAEIYFIVDKMPTYPGGDEKLRTDIRNNIHLPNEAKGIYGKVMVTFVIDEDGYIKNAKIVSGADPLLNKEALRVINSLEKWNSGSFKGKPANVRFSVPINFN